MARFTKWLPLFLALAVMLTMVGVVSAEVPGKAQVRVVHASPDAPAVDVLVNGGKAFTNAPFKGITPYAKLDPGSYKVEVVPTGATTPVVISAALDLKGGTDYTVVALGKLANIAPLVLVDNNSAPAAGKAHLRFVHASADAPAVDVAVKGGPVVFSNVAFKGVGNYTPVDAATYDLEVRPAGKTDVVLAVPGVKLEAGKVYTVFAMGLLSGEPKLMAVPSVDATHAIAQPAKAGELTGLWVIPVLLGAALVIAGVARKRALGV